MAMRLYGSKLSTCTQRVMLVFNELDLSYELISIDMKRGEHKTPDFIRDVHPFGKLPAFEDGSLHIFESRAICRYLVAKYASPDSVMPPPTKLEEIARFEQVASVESSYFDTSIFKIAYEKMFKQFFGLGEADTAEMRKSENDLKEVLDYYDRVLASQRYLTGSTVLMQIILQKVSLVDLFHLPWLHFLPRLGIEDEILSRKNVAVWCERLEQRATWCKVVQEIAS
ncbi:glutathione S-transferase III [Aureobasidium pullulans]|uniref:glutathione transferase n=1 Tax=Aureobasidium pullulans TaxID=5580 RepID=A0A4S8SCM2_AURPU|nr:glutathione S-transferase III [Aureobasidium pullulans]